MNTSLATDQYARGIFNAFAAYRKKFSGGNITVPYLPEPKPQEVVKPKEEVKTDTVKSVVKPEPVQQTVVQPKPETGTVFKVQILTSPKALKSNDSRFKGVTGIDSYQENGLVKYTTGSSADYNEILQLRKDLSAKFPEAFIVAFKDGTRVDVQEAIREFKSKKSK